MRSACLSPACWAPVSAGTSADGDRLLMTHLDGTDWYTARDTVPAHERARLRGDLGRLIGQLHHVRGVGFGYPQHGTPNTGSSWRNAFLAVLKDVLHDARRYNVRLPLDQDKLVRSIDQKAWLLDDVTDPTLVHFDLWDGNVLLADGDGRLEISGIINGERSFWGDPLADLVSPALFEGIADDKAFLAGSYSARGHRFRLNDQHLGRIAMYRIYLALIVLIEGTSREYDPDERAPLTDRATHDLFLALDRLQQTRPVDDERGVPRNGRSVSCEE
ncbi:phosphotransferase family protein [Streptomyces roseolilacinus]|uniref:phosphotransferase family protein n=1 Tax=Streptomyces roseolilacinus TaxID=66904 RepID=UPI0038280BAE